ncbi:MAG: 1-phosphofructokinase family hexose kinase [Rhodobacteraceae bacterium]|nr:1-phosphofructokinase family hexose kinase [Paracoccaceae bacterium]
MRDILTITLNPALDVSASVPHVTAGAKLRCGPERYDPGGGGLNVARAIHFLGGEVRAFAALGGARGAHLARLLETEGIAVLSYAAPGETRESLAITDEAMGYQYRFSLPGPRWSTSELDSALAAITPLLRPESLVVLSGSEPLGTSEDFYPRLCEALSGEARRLLIDTSGAALARLAQGGLKHRPFVLRMDQGEAEALAGRALPTGRETLDFARSLAAKGAAEALIIARGAEGSVMWAGDQGWFANAARVEVVSRVGAGDSFMGGFTLALARGLPLEQALAHGAAAASAAVMTPGTQLCRREDFERLLGETRTIQL